VTGGYKMIFLSDINEWVINAKEVRKHKLPLADKWAFVEMLMEEIHGETPRKWTPFTGGYWDANFDVLSEMLGDIAVRVLTNPWSQVYEMPWGEVIIVFTRVDCGGYDAEIGIVTCPSYDEYLKAVSWETKNQ